MRPEELCFQPADILLPQGCDLRKWSVVACDQFTSEPDYWRAVENTVGDAPSTLRLVLPEVYLEQPDVDSRISAINHSMQDYLDRGLFAVQESCFILVERRLNATQTRYGLLGRVDLDQYDYTPGATSYIRATEGTVLTRLPPRVRVRRDAPLELPHILLLMDDPGRTVIEPLLPQRGSMERLYDFELMQDGGHITGYRLPVAAAAAVQQALCRLADPAGFREKYDVDSGDVLLFASGDGNHSLATAKQSWEELKRRLPPEQWASHPARWALVELGNLHDPSLEFEAIHRVLFDVEPEAVLAALRAYYPTAHEGAGEGHSFEYVYGGRRGRITVEGARDGLPVGTLQDFLDDYLAKQGGRIDYIHGEDVTLSLAAQPHSLGFLVPAMGKNELFRAVITRGALPRKTFSMGHACEKRYYLEARRIK